MPIANQQSVLTHNLLTDNLELGETIFAHTARAESLLRKWIGDTKYEEVRDDTTHEYYTECQIAESLLCFAIALPRLAMQLKEQGGLVKSTGFAESSNVLMGRREMVAYQRGIYQEARHLVRDLLLRSKRIDRPGYLNNRYYYGSV